MLAIVVTFFHGRVPRWQIVKAHVAIAPQDWHQAPSGCAYKTQAFPAAVKSAWNAKKEFYIMNLTLLADELRDLFQPVKGFRKTWVYQERIVPVDFRIRNIRFAFNLVPLPSSDNAREVSVELFFRDKTSPLQKRLIGLHKAGRAKLGVLPVDNRLVGDVYDLINRTVDTHPLLDFDAVQSIPARYEGLPPHERNTSIIAERDKDIYVKYSGMTPSRGRSRARLMFRAHSIEKGLSNTNFRPGFGARAIERLAPEMHRWLDAGYPKDDQFFLASAATMRSYFDLHDDLGFDVSHFKKLFSDELHQFIAQADKSYGGVVRASEKREEVPALDQRKDFVDLVYARRSVRAWTSDTIGDELVQTAVRIAAQAPSVCNRQAPRVHMIDDPERIASAIKAQGGFNGYEMPPKLLLITCDLQSYLSPSERNQAYVDGGLFMMLLLLGLQRVGLGTCCLNTALNIEREERIRAILDIPKNEVFISFVAVGHYDESVLVPISVRLGVDELLVPRLYESEGVEGLSEVKVREVAVDNYIEGHRYPPANVDGRAYDIALFGWHHQGNLGGVLTFFALHQLLEKLGYKILVVWRPSRTRIQAGNRNNFEILRKYYTYSEQLPPERLHELRNLCDTFVLASDQLWAGKWVPFNPEYEFLGAGDESVRKISVATSMGGSGTAFPISGERGAVVEHLIRQIDHISVREPSAVGILEGIGADATQILDPVFLCPKYIYSELMTHAKVQTGDEDYVFGYILDASAPVVEFGRDVVTNKRGVAKSFFTTTMQNAKAKEEKTALWESFGGLTFLAEADVADFLTVLSNANFVFTDSFHGACMATIYHRPFVCCPPSARGHSRFELFDKLGLRDRICERDALDPEIVNQPIDWDQVDERLNAMRSQSFDWLSQAFGRDFSEIMPYFRNR